MQSVSTGPLPVMQTWCEDLISINDLGPTGVAAVLDLAALIKARPEDFRGALAGKQIVMFFEKPSLRTRLTFEAGITSLGGHAFFVDQTASRIDARESHAAGEIRRSAQREACLCWRRKQRCAFSVAHGCLPRQHDSRGYA